MYSFQEMFLLVIKVFINEQERMNVFQTHKMEKEHKTNLRKMEHKINFNKMKIRNCWLTYLKRL